MNKIKLPVRYDTDRDDIIDGEGKRLATVWFDPDHGHQIADALNASEWTPIRTVDDLPKEEGWYLWQFRLVDMYNVQHFSKPPSVLEWFAHEYIAWRPLPEPYREGEDDKKN